MVRVLLVEDNELSADMLARRLTRRGHDVTVARDGAEGVELAARGTPELILMDLDLPVVDGWEATRRIRAGAAPDVPIIALTAHAVVGEREKALAAGCDDYDTKPIELDRLLGKMDALLERRRGS